MRVLQILHGSEPGGVKTLAEDLGRALAAHGIVVETAYLFPPGRSGLLAKAAGAFQVARKILRGRYDALFAYQSSACIAVGIAGRVGGCRHRIAHQTALPGEVRAPMRWIDGLLGASGFYTANVANSRATWAAFARYPAGYRQRMTLIEHGVSALSPRRSRAETLARFGIPDDRPILLNVGRLAAQKNQDVLIAALGAVPEPRLVVAGGGPLRARHEDLARAGGVADRVHLLGDVEREDVGDLLGAADLFVFPSIWESFGIAAVEAAAAGLPILASDLPVLREVLAGAEVPVTYLPPREAGAWVEAIRDSLAAPRAGTRRRVSFHSVGRMADAYLTILAPAGRERGPTGREAARTEAPAEERRG